MLLFLALLAALVCQIALLRGVVQLHDEPCRVRRRHVWFIIWLSLWSACSLALAFTLDPVVSSYLESAALCCFILAVYGWLCCCGVVSSCDPLRLRITRILMILGLPWPVLVWTPLLGMPISLQINSTTVPLGNLGWGLVFWVNAVLLASVAMLAHHVFHAHGKACKQGRYWLAIAIPLAGVGAYTLVVQYQCDHLPWPVAIAPLTIAALVACITYSSSHDCTAQTRELIRTGLTYAMMLASTAVLAVLALPLLGDTANNSHTLVVIAAVVLVVVSLFFFPARQKIQRTLDHLWHVESHYRDTLREAGGAFAAVRDRKVLEALLADTIARAFRPRGLTVYLQDGHGVFVRAAAHTAMHTAPEVIPPSHRLLQQALYADQGMLTAELLRQPGPDQALGYQLSEWMAALALPMVAGDHLCGLVLLMEKESGHEYTADELELWHVLGKQAALAVENVRHYEELRRVNTHLEHSVSERTRQLAQANTTLASINTALDAERAYLDTALNILPLPLLFMSPQGEIVRMNAAFQQAWPEMHADFWQQIRLLHPDTHTDVARDEWPDRRALHGETIASDEFLFALPDGHEVPLIIHAAPIYMGQEIGAVVIAFQDIAHIKDADRAKDEFLAVLSHELLTPLTSILGWSQFARDGGAPGLMEQALQVIERNAYRQRRVLDDLLDVSRIVHKKLTLNRETIDLWDVVEQSAESLQQGAREREIDVSLVPPVDRLTVHVDPNRLAQAITNLLANALKFTEAGGRVTITCEANGEEAIISLRDTGCGFPAEMLDDLFKPFRQIERNEARGGLGLGLALVRGIVELHSGHIRAHSAGKGQGSTFVITLPLVSTEAPVNAS
jgi:signal transduction histidine kinase